MLTRSGPATGEAAAATSDPMEMDTASELGLGPVGASSGLTSRAGVCVCVCGRARACIVCVHCVRAFMRVCACFAGVCVSATFHDVFEHGTPASTRLVSYACNVIAAEKMLASCERGREDCEVLLGTDDR